MDQFMYLVLAAASAAGILAALAIMRRARQPTENRFAASTEGEKRCPNCGMGNQWTDRTCAACGTSLPG
jgi:hypothetical protein